MYAKAWLALQHACQLPGTPATVQDDCGVLPIPILQGLRPPPALACKPPGSNGYLYVGPLPLRVSQFYAVIQ